MMRIPGLLSADEDSKAGVPPTKELLENMGRFIEEVTNAGLLLAAEGFQPSSEGAPTYSIT